MEDMPVRDIQINTRLGRLAARLWGRGDGCPVIALHGWLDNANTFNGLAPRLSGLHCLALDLPGHGWSDHRPPGGRYHFIDYVDDVLAVADAMQWERFGLLGHSMGAGIACFLASAFPERVTHLALIEGLGAMTVDPGDAAQHFRRSVLGLKRMASEKHPEPKPLDLLIRARAGAGRIALASAEVLVRRSVTRVGDGYIWCSDRRLKIPPHYYVTDELMLAYLRAITAPALLIAADQGLLVQRPYYPARCQAIARLQVVCLPGHHHLHLDDPAPVAAVIDPFMNLPYAHQR